MADLTLAVAESHRAPHQTGASHRPPAKTRVLESGGQRRENSLNPIVARVRTELIALAAEHSNRPEVVKYDPSEPRDDHGRWTSGGDGPTVESLAKQNVTIKNLEDVDPALRRVVLDAAQAFRDRFPPVPLVVQVTPGEQNEIASAQGFMLNLSPEWYGPGAVEQWAVMTPRDRAANWSAEPSPRGTIEHEFGHIIDWMVYHDASDKAFRNAPRYSDTGSGRSEPSERWAEGFSQLWLRPKDEWTPDARIVAKALLAPDVADNIGEQPGTTVYKYDPSQPRGDDGRWVLGAGGANTVWSDPNDAWVSGVPASDRRAAEREQYRKTISEALPRAQFLLPGATSSTLKGLAGASTRFAHLFPGAVDSVAGIGMRAVLAPGVMAETRWREGGGQPNGKTTISLGNYYFGDRSSDRVEVGAVRNIMTGWHVPEETGKEQVIAHEFGHVLQAKYPGDYGVATINFAGRQPVSGYGATKPEENFAEMYVRYAYSDPANWDETTRSTVALLGWPVPESKVVKFDPSQPREPAGSPEGGQFVDEDHEVATPTTIKEAMVHWSEGSTATRASIAAGKPDETAQLLLAGLAKQKDGNAPKLYRGLTLPGSVFEGWGVKVDPNWSSPSAHANVLANQASFGQGAAGRQAWQAAYEAANAAYAAGGTAEDAEAAASASVGRPLHASSDTAKVSVEPGGQFDMNLSSFTPRASYAAGFASGFAGNNAPGEPVVLHLERGATALRLTEQAVTLDEPEREWLTGGRFEVVDAKYANFSTPDYGTQRYLRVTIRQVGKLESTAEKFDPSQPRDDHGRWTADDREALEQYGMTSDYLNEQLKEGVPLDTQPRFPLNWSNDELVRQIDGAFSRAKPTSELLTMFRGVGSDEVGALVPGATLTYPGYVSTTPSRDVAATYGRVVPVIIPAGSRVIEVDSVTGLTTFETETLLPRGSTFRYDESGLTFVPDTAEKYDKDQARVPAGSADGGQWTADTSVYGVTIASVTTINRAVETYREAHPRTVIDDSLLRGRPDFIIPALEQMAQLQDQFPNVWIGWVGMQATGTGAFGGSDGGATMAMHFPGRSVPWTPEQKVENDEMATALGLPIEAGDGTRGSSIFLNERYFGADAPDNAFWTPQFGYHPPGVDDAAGIMTHEFGHAVDSTMNEAADLWSDRKMMVWSDWRDDAARRYANPEMGGSLASISTYARIGGFSEAFADLFAAAYSPGTLPYDPKGSPMTARSRLNSETQGYVNAMRSVLVDSGATVAKVVKYSESQPRDERGRWTATGMAAAEADPTGAGYQWPDGTVTRWPDLKTAKAEYQKAHPDTLLYLGRLDRVKPVEMMVALDQLDKVQQQLPGVRISEVAIRKDKYENKGTTVASCRQQGVGSASAISLNPAYWAVGGKSLNGYDRGWHPDGVSNPAGYMTHEFGHAVDNYYSTAEPADDREERERVGHWKDMAWDFARPDGRPISGYARTRTNSASVTSEGFAEAFAEAFTPGTPGADQPNALALKDLLTTYGGYVAKVDFFTEGGAVHPIRGSEGYDPVLAGDIDRPAIGQYSITTAPYLQTSSYDQVCETCHQTIPAGTAFMRGDWTGGLATFEWHVGHDPVGEWKPEGSDARTDAPADRTSPEPPPQLRLSADERTLAVENLNRGAAKFARNGGTVEAASSVHKQWEAYEKFQEMTGSGLTGSDLGPSFARTALESGDDVVNIAWTKEGDIAGAHAYDRTERTTELQQLGGDHSLGHGIVGSTGVVPGVGSALTAAYIRHAASENASIVIAPVASAKTFWRSMGMRQLDGGGWGMSADDVKAIAAELD